VKSEFPGVRDSFEKWVVSITELPYIPKGVPPPKSGQNNKYLCNNLVALVN